MLEYRLTKTERYKNAEYKLVVEGRCFNTRADNPDNYKCISQVALIRHLPPIGIQYRIVEEAPRRGLYIISSVFNTMIYYVKGSLVYSLPSKKQIMEVVDKTIDVGEVVEEAKQLYLRWYLWESDTTLAKLVEMGETYNIDCGVILLLAHAFYHTLPAPVDMRKHLKDALVYYLLGGENCNFMEPLKAIIQRRVTVLDGKVYYEGRDITDAIQGILNSRSGMVIRTLERMVSGVRKMMAYRHINRP
jgi:hypothetical protein